jgi:hypothetical protein
MAISYHIYANDGRGGDVDYATPIATTTALTFTVGSLVAPSDNTFAVRAFDATSGIEEANTDARVRVLIDPAGNEVTARPNPVNGLSVRRTAGGTCWVSWGYDSTGQGGPPTQFAVTLTPGPASPAATVAYLPGVAGYGCSLSGLVPTNSYTIAVQAIGAPSLLTSVASSVAFDYLVNPLSNVDALVAVPSP